MGKKELAKAIEIILTQCLAVKPTEHVLILTDQERILLAEEVFFKTREITHHVKLTKIPIPKVNGTEPPADVSEEMQKQNVIIMLTTRSFSHTNARKQATEKGIRIASMPGITQEIMERTIAIDYGKLKERTMLIADALDRGNTVKVTTKKGTNLTFSIKGRAAHGRKSGIYTERGFWGNLPEGEAFIAPVEGTTNGTMIVDGSIAGIGKVENVKVTIKEGFVIDTTHETLNHQFEEIGKKARNIAEFGVGTNDKAIVTGCVLEDEKVLGTCHIAFGNNSGFGGNVEVQYHVDCVIKDPTIEIDGIQIMENGKLLLNAEKESLIQNMKGRGKR